MSEPTNIAQVNFDPKRRQPYQSVGRRVYVDPRTGNPRKGPFYERALIDGRRTFRKLASRSLRAAEDEASENRMNYKLSQKPRPLAENPYSRSLPATIGELCDLYVKLGCPKRTSKTPRAERSLSDEMKMVASLKEYWGAHTIGEFHPANFDGYYEWRKRRIARAHCSGDRMIERERTVLSSIFRVAVANGLVKTSPFVGVKPTPIQDPNFVRHCREAQPASGDELHALARYLFLSDLRSEVLGWQLLFEAMIGSRSHEILRLRADARYENEPGFVCTNSNTLQLWRSTSHKGTFEFAEIHPALSECLKAHRKWLQKRYPKSPWYLPSPENPKNHVSRSALTKALRERVVPAMKELPPGTRRTSHGLRSFYVNVRRSQGMPDAEIALRIGHKTGGKLIVRVYGEIKKTKLSWMPKPGEEPAWSVLGLSQQLQFKF